MTSPLTIAPVTAERLDDLAALFATNKTTDGCFCMWFLGPVKECHAGWGAVNQARFRSFTTTSETPVGLLAYHDDVSSRERLDSLHSSSRERLEPAGWCAAGPRSRYGRMLRAPVLRDRDPAEDDSVWLVPCFFVRRTARRTGVTRALLDAAVGLARRHGASAIEGFPLAGDQRRSTGDAFVGVEPIFASCGFTVVARPSATRVVMRRDLRRKGRRG
jgi:GNAT superfamily N-acetyltransferase